ncbi:MAG: DNA alkylation repair protein [Clostridiales bacterium]|nr:DNA alkylation repair protein [Clostridiales bacterium]
MLYDEFLKELKSLADEDYKIFHSKLIKNDKVKIIGVQVPVLRKLAKKYNAYFDEIFLFPDEFYEVTFIKLTILSSFEYEKFIKYIDGAVKLINNWATCDCFKAKCIKSNKLEFLPYIEKYLSSGEEFIVRYALTTLLNYYIEKNFLKFVLKSVEKCDKSKYYIHMACAWLVAEILVKYYNDGVEFLKHKKLDKKTHNKAIQKAVESFRLLPEQKTYLKTLKV